MDKLKRAELAQIKHKEYKIKILKSQGTPPGITKAKIYFPFTKLLLRLINIVERSSIEYLNEKKPFIPHNRPVIFACTHKFKQDVEKITISLPKPSFIVASDYKNSYHTIAGWYLNTRPTIFVDPYDKEDRKITYQLMVKYLQSGHNLMIYPEAVWNLSENRIMLNCFLGSVRAALETNAVIDCTAIEKYNRKFIINRKGYLDFPKFVLKKYGQPFGEMHEEKQKKVLLECNQVLRDTLATRMMEIWIDYSEKNGIEKRADIPNNYWSDFINNQTSEWKGYKMSDNVDQQFYSKDEREFFMVQESFNSIIPSLKNAFLFNKRLK